MKINEKMGVPNNIIEEAERIYDIVKNCFNDKIKTINVRSNKEFLLDTVDINIDGDTFKDIDILFKIDNYEYNIIKSLSVISNVSKTENPIIYKRSKNVSLLIEVGINLSTIKDSNIESNIRNKIIDIFNRDLRPSDIAHELKHIYDIGKKDTVGLYDRLQYFTPIPPFLPEELRKVLRLFYILSDIENLVKPTEIYSKLKGSSVNKSNFMDFMSSENIINTCKYARDFKFKDIESKISKESLLYFIKFASFELNIEPSDKCPDNNLYKVLDIVLQFIVNEYLKRTDRLIGHNDYMYKKINRFNGDPVKFASYIEKYVNKQGDKMYKKLYKLYDMVDENIIIRYKDFK